MLIKTFFFNLYTLSSNFSFYLFLVLVITSYTLLYTTLRKKFFFFIIIIITYAVWGFMLNLDGMMLVMLTAEFTIILLFLMTYIQLYSNYSFITKQFSYKYIFGFLILFLFLFQAPNVFFNSVSYYKLINHIVASDFYILYYFLFDKLPIIVVFLTLIISFFSLFFIILYFSLKLTKLESTKNTKSLYFLRKQNLAKQTEFRASLHTFQN